MASDERGAAERFSNRSAQIASIVFGVVFVLIGLPQFTSGGDPFIGWLLVGFGGLSALRGVRSSEVVVEHLQVETRSMIKTRRIALSDLVGVQVVLGRTGAGGGKRECLEFTFKDGSKRRFTELNAPPAPAGGSPTEVRAAALAIQRRLKDRAP